MPLSETLAEARQRAGLTVAQVSERTGIRKAVIEAIEGGDFSACGSDLDARVDIRSIAWVVRADPRPLIAEYDALQRTQGAPSAVGLQEWLAAPPPAPEQREPGLPAMGGVTAAGHASMPRRAGSQAAREPAVPAFRPPGRWLYWAVGVGLVAVLGFGVYSHFAGQQHAALAAPAAGKHAAAHRQAGHSGPSPAPTATRPAAAPAPVPTVSQAAMVPARAAAAPAQTLTPAVAVTPADAAAPGPGGNPSPAPRATGGSHPAGGRGAPGPAHRLAHHRPLPQSGPSARPASGQAQPGHGHGRPDHHRQRARAVQHAAGKTVAHRPGRRHHAGPGKDS